METPVRIVLLGGRRVGKSAIAVRFLTRRYIGEYSSAKDHFYERKFVISGHEVKLQLQDVAGDWLAKSETEIRELVQWANGIVLVYDVCDRHSFHSMQKLVQQLSLIRITFCPVLLIGNKQDIVTGRQVEASEGRVTAAKFKAHFCETSAAELGHVIVESFEKLVQHICNLRSTQASMRQRKISAPPFYPTTQRSSQVTESRTPVPASPAIPIRKKSVTSPFTCLNSTRKTSYSYPKNV